MAIADVDEWAGEGGLKNKLMELNLNKEVLGNHIQRYQKSCVPMAIELVLKLMGVVDLNYYDLQDEKKNTSRGGEDFDKRIINNIQISIEFNFHRGTKFPLEELFKKIKSELDGGNFVNCAVKPPESRTFHAYTIYGYSDDEFLAISTDFNQGFEYIQDMKTRLINEQGSDILTFKTLN